jgi:hypothetical protein
MFFSHSVSFSDLCMLYHNFYCIFSRYLPYCLVPGIYIAVTTQTWVFQWLRLALSKGPYRVGVPPSWGRKQIQFLWTKDKAQKSSKSDSYT